MIVLFLIASNIALVLWLLSHELSTTDLLVMLVSVAAAMDFLVPEHHFLRDKRVVAVVLVSAMLSVTPLAHVGPACHEIVIERKPPAIVRLHR